MNLLKKKKGFTLVELIVVIAIIGILSAVLIPNVVIYLDKAKDTAAMQEADGLKTPYLTWLIEKDDIVDEDTEVPNPKTDFSDYLKGLKLLNEKQDVSELDNSYLTGFKFRASNGIEIEAVYNADTESLTMSKQVK